MTRKDFVLIAQAIAELNFKYENKLFIAEHFANRLQDTNPNFERDKFIQACVKK